LNLNSGSRYSRAYNGSAEKNEALFIPNHGKDPEQVNPRYKLRSNGYWTFSPNLHDPNKWPSATHSSSNITSGPEGLHPAKAQSPAEVIYKIDSANVTTFQQITALFARKNEADRITISVSTTNGLQWKDVWKSESREAVKADVKLAAEVNGAYEILVRINLYSGGSPSDVLLKEFTVQTTTALNSKTQPRLNLGKNTIYIAADDQAESIVLWPELEGGKYNELVLEEKSVASTKKHNGYQGTLYPTKAKEEGYVVYRLDAPRDMTHLTYGGRFYNRAPKSHIDLLHSLDNGQTWTKSWTLSDTAQPWDVIHSETVQIPSGHKSVLVKYLMNSPTPSQDACSIYALRMEANYQPVEISVDGLEVTFAWSEVHDTLPGGRWHELTGCSHTQRVDKLPFKYTINVDGDDHPEMDHLVVGLNNSTETKQGYKSGKDPGGEKFVGTWQTLGHNLAIARKYTLSHPSKTNWDAGDPDNTKLTDGIVGPTYVGGPSYRYGALWDPKTNPTITLDLGKSKSCASFGLNFHGYPSQDSLKGEIKDTVAVQISGDGKNFVSLGQLDTDLHRKDIPVNFMLPDDETLAGHTFRLIPKEPLFARYVRFLITSDRFFCATEIEVLDSIESKPFDLRIALPE